MTRRQTWIAAGLAFGIAALAALLSSQYCAPCLIVPLGLVVGYLAGRGQGLPTANAATQLGARAGVVAGLGAFLGHLAGGALIAALGPEYGANIFGQIVGGPGAETPPMPADPVMNAVFLMGISICIGFIEVALTSGSAALGALMQYQQAGGGRQGTRAITKR
jgi:hypothetical protein